MKLFVVTSKKLSKRQQWVQATHAVAQYMLEYPECEWRNRTLVILGYSAVEDLYNTLKEEGYKVSCFREPYFDGILTAFAGTGINEKVKDLPLL